MYNFQPKKKNDFSCCILHEIDAEHVVIDDVKTILLYDITWSWYIKKLIKKRVGNKIRMKVM